MKITSMNKKKKILVILLAVVMVFSLFACSTASDCTHKDEDANGKCDSCNVSTTVTLIKNGEMLFEFKEVDEESFGKEVNVEIALLNASLNYLNLEKGEEKVAIKLDGKADVASYEIKIGESEITLSAKDNQNLVLAIGDFAENVLGLKSDVDVYEVRNVTATINYFEPETAADIPIVGNLFDIKWQQVVMWVIGAILIYLAIAKDMEPTLLLPMGFGAILVNLPNSAAIGSHGPISMLFNFGIDNGELFPLLLFIGIGAMIDFSPLLSNPKLFLFGAAAQFGIFITLGLSALVGFDLKDAASIAIIGAADGPTAIFVANVLESNYLAPIMVAAYSYMALVPVIQPPVIRLITTKNERMIRMEYSATSVKKITKILFPIVVTVITGIIAPDSAVLIGFLMFGNLIRECGVLNALSDTAQKVLANLITLLLGITIAAQMTADKFIQWQTLLIIALGLFAFIFDTVGGVMFAKFINLFSKKKVNPMIGAAGISAFPMSSRVIHKMGLEEDPSNFLLMHAAGANVSGQIASVIAGGLLLALVG